MQLRTSHFPSMILEEAGGWEFQGTYFSLSPIHQQTCEIMAALPRSRLKTRSMSKAWSIALQKKGKLPKTFKASGSWCCHYIQPGLQQDLHLEFWFQLVLAHGLDGNQSPHPRQNFASQFSVLSLFSCRNSKHRSRCHFLVGSQHLFTDSISESQTTRLELEGCWKTDKEAGRSLGQAG